VALWLGSGKVTGVGPPARDLHNSLKCKQFLVQFICPLPGQRLDYGTDVPNGHIDLGMTRFDTEREERENLPVGDVTATTITQDPVR
jgi:hypothetical protein